jgi:hypothetical protein
MIAVGVVPRYKIVASLVLDLDRWHSMARLSHP